MARSQINSLIPNPFFGHNLCFKYPNGSCEPIFDIFILKYFQWYKYLFNLMIFYACNCHMKIQDSIWTPIPKVGAHLGVWVHSLALSYIPKSMKCDSRASLLACTFASSYLGREPKAKVMTSFLFQNS